MALGARRVTRRQADTLPECFNALQSTSGLNGTFCSLFPAGRVPGEDKDHPFGPENHEIAENGVDKLHNVSVPTLLPFIVPGSDMAIVIAPGGGYEILDWNGEGTDVAAFLNSIGVSAFILKYRVPERYWLGFGGAPYKDGQRAMRLVRHFASGLGINPKKVGMMGFSAGGHLTAYTSTHYSHDYYDHIDGADTTSSRPELSFLQYPWKLLGMFDRLTMHVTKNTPPAFLVHTKDDQVAKYENSVKYHSQLQRRGLSTSELHLFETAPVQYGHGYGNCVTPAPDDANAAVCSWPKRAALFLDAHWKADYDHAGHLTDTWRAPLEMQGPGRVPPLDSTWAA